MGTTIFFLLSSLTGVIEVGTVLYAINQGYSVVQVLMLVLAYQIGCFFPTNVMLKKPVLIIFGCIAFALAVFCSYIPSLWLLVFAVLFISPCLQMARSIQKSSVSTGAKRAFRILGFAVSPLFSPILLSAMALIIVVITVFNKKPDKNELNFRSVPLPNFIMIVHQMHYFSYAYIVLIIANTFDKYNGFLTALIFVLGWVTYTSAQYIFRGKRYFTYLVCGHIFLVLVLFTMAICSSEIVKVVLWILTGFGGGTVFCIKEVLKQCGKYDKYALETSENYGHLLGVICSIATYSVFRSMDAPIVFASICAAITVLLVSIFRLNSHGEVNTSYDQGK